MGEWLYKATSNPPNPSLAVTRSFAVQDGILSRSARTAVGTWVAKVRDVAAFLRQRLTLVEYHGAAPA